MTEKWTCQVARADCIMCHVDISYVNIQLLHLPALVQTFIKQQNSQATWSCRSAVKHNVLLFVLAHPAVSTKYVVRISAQPVKELLVVPSNGFFLKVTQSYQGSYRIRCHSPWVGKETSVIAGTMAPPCAVLLNCFFFKYFNVPVYLYRPYFDC